MDYIPRSHEEEERRKEALKSSFYIFGATVSTYVFGYRLFSEITTDFENPSNLHIFGFGVGYGQLLYAMKRQFGSKVGGVDASNYSESLTSEEQLGVMHDTDFTKPLPVTIAADVTYSINVLDPAIIGYEDGRKLLDNLALTTKRGGKSYHVSSVNSPPIRMEDAAARGFRIDHWEKDEFQLFFVKMTKIS